MKSKLQSINPANNKIIREYSIDEMALVDNKIELTHNAFLSWKFEAIEVKKNMLLRLSDVLLENKQYLAQLATEEMGKPIHQSLAEVEKCAMAIKYYSDHAEELLESIKVSTEAAESYITFQPLGVVLAIMPWNFPYWQVFRAMAPILLGGNAMLLKHASNVSGCALAIKKMCNLAGFPKDLFHILLIPSADVAHVIKHNLVAAITLTGSKDAGSKVASVAGSVLKKQVLELGGSDAYVILEDADLEWAVKQCVQSRLNNSGQSCIAAKRFIVMKSVAVEFTKLFVEEMKTKKFGDPNDSQNDIGPLARIDLRDELHEQVEKSINEGAELLLGGYIPNMEGAYYPPTVLNNVRKGMEAYAEEMFGPVASIIIVNDEEEAFNVANDNQYGLGGGIFSRDIQKAKELAEKYMDSGSVFINSFVSSDPRLPFGGIKNSGYGRELSIFGLREFVNVKSISVK